MRECGVHVLRALVQITSYPEFEKSTRKKYSPESDTKTFSCRAWAIHIMVRLVERSLNAASDAKTTFFAVATSHKLDILDGFSDAIFFVYIIYSDISHYDNYSIQSLLESLIFSSRKLNFGILKIIYHSMRALIRFLCFQ